MQIEYRPLSRETIGQLAQLDRGESVERIHYLRNGRLVLEEERWEVPDWSPVEKARRIAALQELYDRGATFYGAFDGPTLVGMSVLDHTPLCSGADRLNLAGLWVSQAYRGRGIGKALFRLGAEEARVRGAKMLYVSATPSENTVRFYRAMGCRLADPVDPDLYELEPEDIHLELPLPLDG